MATPRGRIVLVALTLFIVYFLFIAAPAARSEKEYRQRTEDGLARRHSKLQGDISDEDWTRQTNAKLQSILDNQVYGSGPRKANGENRGVYGVVTKGDDGSGDDGEEEDDEPRTRLAETVVAGRHRSHHSTNGRVEHLRPKYPKTNGDGQPIKEEKEVKDPGKDRAREQLQAYLKSPIVIFSKSYCPHSKRAKQLLTKMYTITPAPLVVELDQLTEKLPSTPSSDSGDANEDRPGETMGRKIQDLLAEISGRSTVPNIMVGMQSIGGNDLIWEMHEKGTLVSEIQRLGGKRVRIELNQEAEGGGDGGHHATRRRKRGNSN